VRDVWTTPCELLLAQAGELLQLESYQRGELESALEQVYLKMDDIMRGEGKRAELRALAAEDGAADRWGFPRTAARALEGRPFAPSPASAPHPCSGKGGGDQDTTPTKEERARALLLQVWRGRVRRMPVNMFRGRRLGMAVQRVLLRHQVVKVMVAGAARQSRSCSLPENTR
jgi:hypothetical protein